MRGQDAVRLRLLGPVQIVVNGQVRALGGGKQRALLAALVLGRSRPVSLDRLCQALWGDDPPSSAAANIRTYASSLRRTLGSALSLTTQRPGYLLEYEPGQCDLDEFENLIALAATAIPQAAAMHLGAALAIWRGDALDGVPVESALRAEAARLDELRRIAIEDHAQARLELGQHTQLIPALRGLTSEFPLRERLWEQLIIAQHRCGRRAEALESFAQVRSVLADELGVEPGPRLRRAHESLLCGDLPQPRPVMYDLRAAVDPIEVAMAQRSFGRASAEAGRIDEALEFFDASLRTFHEYGRVRDAAYVLAYRSHWLNEAGRCAGGLEDGLRALALMRDVGDLYGSVLAQRRIGTSLIYLERFDEARDQLAEALRLAVDLEDAALQADVLSAVGGAELGTGDFVGGRDAFVRSGSIYQAIGQAVGEAYALLNTARCGYHLGERDEARELLLRARAIFAASGDRRGQAYCSLWLGKVLDGPAALQSLNLSRRLFRELGMRRIEAEALCEMVPVLRSLDRPVPARNAALQAWELLSELDDPTALRAQQLLTDP